MCIYAFPHMCVTAAQAGVSTQSKVADLQLANVKSPNATKAPFDSADRILWIRRLKADDLLTWEASPWRAEGTCDPLRVWRAFLLKANVSQKNPNCAFTACRSVGPPTFPPCHTWKKKRKSSGKPCLLLSWHRKAIICSPGQPSDVLVWFFNIYSIWFHLFLRL